MRPSVKIHGGLGNQLFCYAFSLYVSKVLGIKVYVDVESGFKNDFFERTLSLEKIGFELYLPDQKVLDKNK